VTVNDSQSLTEVSDSVSDSDCVSVSLTVTE